jgi:D-aspartate ligase
MTTPAPTLKTRAQKSSSTATIGAVVMGGDYQGLGIVRSLGRHNIPVFVIDDERSVSRFSRYATKSVKVKNLRDERQTVEELLEIGTSRGLEGWVLFPTLDEQVATLSRNRDELGKIYRVATPGFDAIQWAWDKRNTYQLAKDLGIPIPNTYYPHATEDLAEFENEPGPFAIKPAIKEHFIYATKAKAWCANNYSELRTQFQRAAEIVGPGEVMVQEVIPGGGSQQFSYCAFFREGRAVGKMVARRRRQHPLQFGRASTYVETVDLPILEELSERFLRAINYYGLVELEYKLDARDGKYKLLDVNARTWGYHSLGAHAGVDFSYMLYADQVGLPVTPCAGKSGVGWVRMMTDLPAACVAILAGDTDINEYVRSLRSSATDAVFSTHDPWLGIAEIFLLPYLAAKRGF